MKGPVTPEVSVNTYTKIDKNWNCCRLDEADFFPKFLEDEAYHLQIKNNYLLTMNL